MCVRAHLLHVGGGAASDVRRAGCVRAHLLQFGGGAASDVRLAGRF